MKMSKRTGRCTAALAAMTVLTSGAAAFPAAAADQTYIFRDGFEQSAGGWQGRGAAGVRQTSAAHCEGSGALYVSGRTAAWNGAAKDLDPAVFSPGTAYSFSADVQLLQGEDRVALTLQYNGADGKTHYDGIASADGSDSGWVQVANVSYEIPADAKNMQLYVETGSSLTDFYLDEVIAAAAGTEIEGPKPVPFIRGDLNADGRINAIDLTWLKRYLMGTPLPDARTRKAADINQDNHRTAADLVQLTQFLLGIIPDFTKEAYVPGPGEEIEYEKNYDFKSPQQCSTSKEIPDPFLFADGSAVEDPADWGRRASEIRCMYEYYMYGVWRDGSDEEVSYTISGNKLTVRIKRLSTGKTASFPAVINLPSKVRHEGGAPVIIGMHNNIAESTAQKRGYAVLTVDGDLFSNPVASDNTAHKGAFYELYPYGSTWEEQSGVLTAWSWGCSKILDALYAGAAQELNINPDSSIVTGVSRWGKATAVCGAFDKRFKMVAPSCSGAGGLALFRYMSAGKTYDFSSKGASSSYRYGDNEPLNVLQSQDERGWFNSRFLEFRSGEQFPFDQHMLGSLVADPDRYLFIIASCINEDWVNAPSMWCSYLGMRHVWDYLGISDHLAINIHKEGHAVIEEDVRYMCEYFDYHVYGIEPELDLNALQTSVFALPQNTDPFFSTFASGWLY